MCHNTRRLVSQEGAYQMNSEHSTVSNPKKRVLSLLLLIAGGILINLAGARLALFFRLPLFLDSIGTVLAAVLGGYMPGIAVGFLTNVLNGLSDFTTAYYSSISVLIAICSAYLAGKGAFRRVSLLLPAALLLALIGGGLGSILTWFLYGGGIGEGISAPFARSFYESGRLSLFLSQLSADLLIDFFDKLLTVFVAALVLRLLPQRFLNRFRPAGTDRSNAAASQKVRRISLRGKILLMISASVLLIAVTVSLVSLSLFRRAVVEEKSSMALGVAATASSVFDHERIEEYLTDGDNAPGYAESEARLSAIRESSGDISYVYVYQICEDGCHVVFDPDTEDTPGAAPGSVIGFDEAFLPYREDLLAGRPLPEPIISDETYGWLLTVYLPVYNDAGECQCYVGVDISMAALAAAGNVFLVKILSLFFGFFVLVLAIGAYAAEHEIIQPVNQIAAVSASFAAQSDESRKGSLDQVRALDIRTGDEIESLYHSVRKMSEDVVVYIDDAQKKNEQIAKLQNGLILVLADLVESRDKCTGNHVRNTAAYAKLIMEKMRETGKHTDELTDSYLLEVENGAPLHDVGKIQIPDALLNKPGKLTDEEFAEMKCHTLRGTEIIDRAIGMVSDDSADYLKEARNLTLYHHERWDGKGYPNGLKGDEIPLSARIMAVADVFDALVARRSYKDGFPFDTAIDIIRKESGTHFDPEVVEAFLQCQDEARAISEQANRKSLEEY